MVKENYIETLILVFSLIVFAIIISLAFALIPFGSLISSIILMPYVYLIYASYYTSKRKSIRRVRRKKVKK